MEQAKFLAAGPCKDAARVLEDELNQHRELLPHTITYEGKQVPMTMDRLSREYPNISNNYLLELLGRFLSHFKETGDPTILRVSALRHGDKSLLTMLSAFVPHEEVERCNYLTMTPSQLDKLSIHRMLIAREMGARVLKKNEMPTSLSTFYRERVTISGHRNPVYSVAFDKTNRRLFTGSDDFLVKVWCVRTGHLIHTIRGHQNVITDIAINQENTLIATASTDGCVRVWTMDEYKPIMCLRPNTTAVKPFTTVKFSPSPRAETRYLMATNEDGFVRLWKWDRDTLQFFDVDSPITFSCRFRAKDRLRCSSFDYTGTKFTVAGDDGFVYVFSTVQVQTTHEGLVSQGSGHADVVTDLAFSHDGQRILSGCQDGTARIWTFSKEYKQWSSITLSLKEPVAADADIIKPSTPVSTVMSRSTSINQNTLNDIASTSKSTEEFGTLMPSLDDDNDDHNLHAVSSSDMDLDVPAASVDPPKVSMIAWSADDRWCFVASNYGEIRVYYAFSGEIACVLKGHEGEIYALDNHPLDSSTILSAGYDGNVILWDVQKKKVINCTKHRGRTFTDCKFSKDGMKYAITDEEGHCTLFGIGGLDKDYEQVRSWERGQYFMSDYQALRHFADGTFVDEPTQQLPYALPFSPIIDLQGVAYPNQKKLGYGRNIPTTPETFELEDIKRSACYDQEEEEIRALKLITLPALDRATVARRRREFVRFEDDEEGDLASAGNIQFQFPPPVLPALLPDDSADEDYHDDEAGNAGYASSANSSDDERGSDEFVTRDNDIVYNSEDDNDEDGPVTRSRAGQQPIRTPRTTVSSSNNTLRHTTTTRRRGRGRGGGGIGRGRGRGRGGSRATRKRNREASDDEEDQPVRARTRRRVTERPSYAESDFESEEEFVDVDNDESDAQDSDHSEAGPSNRANYNIDTGAMASTSTSSRLESFEPEDRKGKRKLRSAAAHDSDDEFNDTPYQLRQYQHYGQNAGSSSSGLSHNMASASTSTGRATRSRAHLPDTPAIPTSSITHKPPPPAAVATTTKASTKRSVKHREGPRVLTEDEIKEHEPIPWITNTERSLAKYLPQVGDIVAILTEGHKQYLKKSQMRHLFDEKHGVIDKHEPVLFARVNSISWLVGPPAYCKLKLHMLELNNLQQVIQGQQDPVWSSMQQDEIIEYTDEDDSPEFIVLWERFLASMNVFLGLQVGQKVDAIYDEGQYTGTVSNFNNQGQVWKRANLPSPWAFYHVIWDDASSNAEDLSPWELVPTGEDFRTRYDVGSSLTPAQIKRAKDTIAWLASMDDFYLYVRQVDYYENSPYLSTIAYPICLDTVSERLDNGFYRSVDGLIDDVELIKKNAMKYNAESSPAHKNAIRLAHFFKTRIQKPSMPLALSKGGGNRKKVVVEESDDEYDNDVEEQRYESEEEPRISRKERHFSDEEDDFEDDDDEDDDY
ncbi:hypothetical protein HMPREF1544_00941 [Mucor circinelloides 1006PhL]|uniref:Bromo domain-containing protein n=1 Tax=Mucor circinelloides f. circinelloides (strain 1006PhL) TaxID=1220926 RepID=S2JP43_MUCC1|nr:hypothetical protein HMPREF1544_00941 [Mucor circinelloides 1006PhL]